MKVQYKHVPEDIMTKYNLQDKVTKNNCIYIKIKKECVALNKPQS